MKLLDITTTKHLASKTANYAFNGVYCGMYASGNGADINAKTYFNFFVYELLKDRNFLV